MAPMTIVATATVAAITPISTLRIGILWLGHLRAGCLAHAGVSFRSAWWRGSQYFGGHTRRPGGTLSLYVLVTNAMWRRLNLGDAFHTAGGACWSYYC